MALSPALQAVIAVFRTRASELLPAYFLTPAIAVIARVAMLVGIAVSTLYLVTTGRLSQLSNELADYDLEPPDPEAEPEAFGEWAEGLVPILETVFPPTVVAVLLVAGLVTVVTLILLYAVATAAQLTACRATLQDRRGTRAAIDGGRRHWLPMLLLLLFEVVLWGLATVVAVMAVGVASLVSPILGIITGLFVFLLWAVVVLTIRAIFAFAPVAVVVDDAGISEALTGAVGFIRSNLADALGYYLLAIGAFGILAAMAGLAGEAGGTIVGVATFLLVSPGLGLFKTALYARHADFINPPAVPEQSLGRQTTGGLRRGWRVTKGFVRETPGLHGLSVAFLVGGFAIGWALAAPFEGVVTASIESRLGDHFAPTAALLFTTNNWSVAVGTALSGLVLGVPAAVSMLFNGVAFGIVGRLEVAPLELLAFVVPHGLFEIPAIAIAGALGLYLGRSGWRTYRTEQSRSGFADDIERGFWVLVGLAILLTIAGVIEGFVSPYYYQPFLLALEAGVN